MGMLRVSLANQMGEIRRINSALGDFLSEEGVPDRTIHHVKLVVEELVSNVVRYAFDDEAPGERIEVDVRTEPKRIVVTVQDSGRPFNPNDAPPPPALEPLRENRVGGMGIFLVKKLASELTYARENNRNRVRAIIEHTTR
jgi:anti-sigma regulatory factor (Ser/Thr protein kinase)